MIRASAARHTLAVAGRVEDTYDTGPPSSRCCEMSDRETIISWLTDWGVGVQDEALPDESFAWVISLKPESAFSVTLARKAVDYTWLQMECALNLVQDHRDALTSMDDDSRDKFIFNLRLKMASLPVGYTLIVDENDGILSGIVIGLNILEDPLQRAGFFRRHHQVQSAAQIAAIMVQRMARFGE